MKPETSESLLQFAGQLDLVPHAALEQAFHEAGGHGLTADEFGQVLVRRELLTGFQLERLLRGDRRGFFFGRAKLLYQIGAGAFARVFRAVQRDSGGIVAVKVLRTRYANDPEKCRAFQHEGEIGRLLRHPNIVAIEDVGQENGTSYITMEFVEGQTLRELTRIRGAVDLPRALELILQMILGLEYAHGRGVTHRDLKPSNVIVSSTGVAKLVDFGLAGVDDGGDRVLGRVEKPRTIDYATLENVTGMRDDGVRSDIFFLGTIFYLTLAGTSALADSRDRSVRADPRRYTGIEPLGTRAPDLPRDVVDFVQRAMHLDPLERWQTTGDMRRALEQIIARRSAGSAEAPAAAAVPTARGSLMLVESSAKAQQSLREFFGKLGYRVLLTENPQRALARFSSIPPPADCLVISTHTLGRQALEAFNAMADDPFMVTVPAILLVGARQDELAAGARTDVRRLVVKLPIAGEEMGRVLASLGPQRG